MCRRYQQVAELRNKSVDIHWLDVAEHVTVVKAATWVVMSMLGVFIENFGEIESCLWKRLQSALHEFVIPNYNFLQIRRDLGRDE